jgi:peptide/nickel transport system substrate-binding protein
MYKFNFIIIGILFFTVTLIVGCKKSQNDETIFFGIAQKPQTLDPRFSSDAASERLSKLIYTPLIFFNEDFTIRSNLVKTKKISSKKYNFTVIGNPPKFHNGTPLDIDDIISTIKHLMQSSASPYSKELKIISAINKISSNEFEILLKKTDHNFLSKLSFSILPKTHIDSGHSFATQPIGSGPFEFISNKPNIQIRRILDNQLFELVEIKDPTVRVLKLVNAEIDIIQNDLPLELINYLTEQSDINHQLKKGVNVSYIGFNFMDPLLKNHNFRKALAMSIDRASIAKYFFNTKTRIAQQILPPEHWASQDIQGIEYNPNKAKKMLRNILPEKKIKLTYKTSTDPFRLKIATIIQAQLAEVGLEMSIKTLDWGTYFQDIQSGNFQLYGLTWVGIRSPEIYEKIFSSDFIPPNGLNRGKYSDLSMNLYINNAKINNDWSPVILEVSKKIGSIPLWYEGNFSAYRDNIKGFKTYPNGSWDGLMSAKKI